MTYLDIHTHYPAVHADDTVVISLDVQPERVNIDNVLESTQYYSVGVHPWHSDISLMPHVCELAKHPSVLAIGETGIDLNVAKTTQELALQKELFVAHAQLSEDLQKPLIVHCVKAWSELLHIRKTFRPSVSWIIHGFRGNELLAAQLLNAGLYLSFGVHFQTQSLQAAWHKRRLLVETDNSQMNIRTVYKQIADNLNITENDLLDEIELGIPALFGISCALHYLCPPKN